MTQERKTQHLHLTGAGQSDKADLLGCFDYEPMLSGHPDGTEDLSCNFLGKKLSAPIWISSMTGGSCESGAINRQLAQVASEFGLGMGLGSCRSLLDNNEFFDDFNLRPVLGKNLPLYANLGIAQLERLLHAGEQDKIFEMLARLDADGLIIHVNPLQEWFQPEGDRFLHPPIETIQKFLQLGHCKVIVKEVGQGIGPASLKALMQLPLAAIEFAAFGGTNFSKVELLRGKKYKNISALSLANVGHSAEEMVSMARYFEEILGPKCLCPEFIISGGIPSFLEGYHLISGFEGRAIYGQAKVFLEHALAGKDSLRLYVKEQLEGLSMARRFLRPKKIASWKGEV